MSEISQPTTPEVSTPAATTEPEATPAVEATPDNTPPATTDSTLLTGDKAAPEGDGKPAEEPAAATPIEYTDFSVAEGYGIADDHLAGLKEFGQANNLTQEALQQIVDMGVQIQQRSTENYQKQVAEWEKQSKSDPEYGGEKFDQTLSTAKTALSLPRGDKVSTLLNESGLGNHPDVIAWCAEIGKLMQEDGMVTGGRGAAPKTLGAYLYD